MLFIILFTGGVKLLKRSCIVLLFAIILVGCSNSVEKELSNYIENRYFDTNEKAYNELEKIENAYIKKLEAGETDEVLTILNEEFIPKIEEIIDETSSYEGDNEEVIDLNDQLVHQYTALKDRTETQTKAFQLLTEMESDEDQDEVITLMEKAIEQSEEFIEAMVTFEDTLEEMIDEHEPEVTAEKVKETEIKPEDAAEMVYNEFGFFMLGIDMDPDILTSQELDDDLDDGNASELQVKMDGQIKINDGYLIQGKSNLPEDAELEAVVLLHREEVSKDHTTYTKADGSFEIEVPDLDISDGEMEVQVRFRPAEQVEELQDVYGEVGENMEGDYIYLYSSIKRKYHEARMTAYFSASEEGKVAFEKPKWDPPSDYGELDIWMEIEELEEHDAYYDVHVRSNFAEGTRIKGDIEVPNHETGGFQESTFVQPDGSFQIQFQKPDVDEETDVHIILEMLPNSLLYMYTEELYGENGEHIQGDLVEKNKGGQKIHYKYSVQNKEQIKE